MTPARTTVRDCVAVLDECYPPDWAESWDAVGLAVGDPDAPVTDVLLAVDPTPEVAVEAAGRAQLLVTHHPLFLRGVHGVAETGAGGKVVATLIRAGTALFTAHTNADVAAPGVSDALAVALGLHDIRPIADRVGADRNGSQQAGRGSAGDRDAGSRDAGRNGIAGPPGRVTVRGGLGRIGELAAYEPLGRFCERVAAALPRTASGVRTTSAADRPVRRIAVCGGSGGALAAAATAAGADVLVTADCRHHHTLDAVAAYPLVVVDVAHWASEWPWLDGAAERLRAGLAGRGRTVNTMVSTLVTDPWRLHVLAGKPEARVSFP